MKVVLATRNQGKIKEFSELLSDLSVEIIGIDQFPQIGDIEETGTTFKENATIKATTVAKLTGLPAVADDSGLLVDVLDGAPGVNSARFAGAHGDDSANNQKLLKMLEGVVDEDRTGRFCCNMALSLPGGRTHIVEGTCEGKITREPMGENGFGYDPLFIPNGYQITMGQMANEEKNIISHRAKAVVQVIKLMEKIYQSNQKSGFSS